MQYFQDTVNLYCHRVSLISLKKIKRKYPDVIAYLVTKQIHLEFNILHTIFRVLNKQSVPVL